METQNTKTQEMQQKVLREKLIATNAYMKKKRSQITVTLQELEKKELSSKLAEEME